MRPCPAFFLPNWLLIVITVTLRLLSKPPAFTGCHTSRPVSAPSPAAPPSPSGLQSPLHSTVPESSSLCEAGTRLNQASLSVAASAEKGNGSPPNPLTSPSTSRRAVMAYSPRRRGPNVSQYIANLNTVSPENPPADDYAALERDLSMFTNAEFYNFDVGTDHAPPPSDFSAEGGSVDANGVNPGLQGPSHHCCR